jgi:phenylalanyl-tRNA synthetase beta chain
MKVSLNAVKQFVDFELPAADKLIAKIGAQLGAVEEVVDLGAKYQGIVVAKVIQVEKHPDADKLHVCRIDVGKSESVQVVCGAPNVREGMLAAWLPPGTVVPSTIDRDPFTLEAREIRGQTSNGMLASLKELAIGDDHDGILEVDKDAKPGDDFAKLYKLDDIVIDIENKMFTHRPDCFGIIGVAREIAGILNEPFKSPNWYRAEPELPAAEGDLKFSVKNELPELVPRFTAIAMSDVKVGPSPVWLQVALTKFGQKPVNNVVDLTNFYMMVSGQPLHAYDYDKVKALSSGEPTIVIRNPKKGEKIKLLNGKEIEPRGEAMMIATDKQLIGIGGVMGGTDTEVDESTRNIILECANFDMYSIRRTGMHHGLFTDAVTRFTKGQSALQCPAVSVKTVADIKRLAGGKVASSLIDDKHNLELPAPVKVSPNFINERLGEKLSAADIKRLLENVEFRVGLEGEELSIDAPFWRTDIEIPEDIVEEVGRLYGYDHLPLVLPKRDLTPAPKDPLLELKSQIRARLAGAGANEVLTYSFVHGDLFEKAGQDKSRAFQIANALSPDLQYYRLSLTPSLLEKVHPNIKAGHNRFALFEIGRTHDIDTVDDDKLPQEFNNLSFVFAAEPKAVAKDAGAPFYYAKRYFVEVLKSMRIWRATRFVPLGELDIGGGPPNLQQCAKVFEPGRSAFICDNKDIVWGIVGEYKASVRKALKLPAFCSGFELTELERFGYSWPAEHRYQPLSRFPKTVQDMTLKADSSLNYERIEACLGVALEQSKPKNSSASLVLTDIFQHRGDQAHKNFTFRLEIASYDRTLTDTEVNKLLDTTATAAKQKFGAERV